MSRQQIVNELHKYKRKFFTRRKVILKGIDDLFQADLVEMIPLAKINNGYKYILTIIDCFSKYAWAIPVKNKSAKSISAAMRKTIEESHRIPKNLQTDLGKEFYNHNFSDLMKEFKINHYSTYTHLKASIVERFNRTLKERMWKLFSFNGTYKWINIIEDILKDYNNTIHQTINLKPAEVNSRKIEQKLLKTVYNYEFPLVKNKYKVGQYVRISKLKDIFEKGHTPNWSPEIFKIVRVNKKFPATYQLQDYEHQIIKGQFYEKELQPTKNSEAYLVEKIIQKRGNRVLVKWLGFDEKHNSWIKKSEII